MILIVGSETSGKRSYARSLGYTDDQMADGFIDESPVIFNVQDLLRADSAKTDELFELLLSKQVVICNEVGSGVIPANEADIRYREAVGRLCVRLAAQADRVVRMVCGIPVLLKG
ncbi:MAG: bifunctional adenosylcobinamide kinase/adenosylcobinamide-phosphate guanylyltransferase [bacterium]|nr:bifunctional adenosylcobinamide kinase/adenosylcobinamide-phosphate guanylyltransferase [bacterium]